MTEIILSMNSELKVLRVPRFAFTSVINTSPRPHLPHHCVFCGCDVRRSVTCRPEPPKGLKTNHLSSLGVGAHVCDLGSKVILSYKSSSRPASKKKEEDRRKYKNKTFWIIFFHLFWHLGQVKGDCFQRHWPLRFLTFVRDVNPNYQCVRQWQWWGPPVGLRPCPPRMPTQLITHTAIGHGTHKAAERLLRELATARSASDRAGTRAHMLCNPGTTLMLIGHSYVESAHPCSPQGVLLFFQRD